MKIGIVSDTHGSLTAWRMAYMLLKEADVIVHCGDVLYHGPRNPLPDGYQPRELAEELNGTTVPLLFAKGNCDAEVDQLLLDYPLESPYLHLITPDFKILFHHGHHFAPEEIPAKIARNYQVVVSGHTHLPGIQRFGSVITLNPGSPSLPKNQPQLPTVAMIDGRQLKILELHHGTVLESLAI